jgi:hypothetical protein
LENRGQNGFCQEAVVGDGGDKVAQIMYTYISKCKNDKINLKIEYICK